MNYDAFNTVLDNCNTNINSSNNNYNISCDNQNNNNQCNNNNLNNNINTTLSNNNQCNTNYNRTNNKSRGSKFIMRSNMQRYNTGNNFRCLSARVDNKKCQPKPVPKKKELSKRDFILKRNRDRIELLKKQKKNKRIRAQIRQLQQFNNLIHEIAPPPKKVPQKKPEPKKTPINQNINQNLNNNLNQNNFDPFLNNNQNNYNPFPNQNNFNTFPNNNINQLQNQPLNNNFYNQSNNFNQNLMNNNFNQPLMNNNSQNNYINNRNINNENTIKKSSINENFVNNLNMSHVNEFNKIINEELNSPVNRKTIFDYLEYNKNNLKLSTNTKHINNHLLTKYGNFFCCISNINANKNTEYLVNIDLLQKFKFDRNLLELYIYGLNQYLISKSYLNIPKHISTFKINTGNNDNLSLLLYSKKKVENSFITINNLTISKKVKNIYENNFNSENSNNNIEYYTKNLFNTNFDEEFFSNYNELQKLCYTKSTLDNYIDDVNNDHKNKKKSSVYSYFNNDSPSNSNKSSPINNNSPSNNSNSSSPSSNSHDFQKNLSNTSPDNKSVDSNNSGSQYSQDNKSIDEAKSVDSKDNKFKNLEINITKSFGKHKKKRIRSIDTTEYEKKKIYELDFKNNKLQKHNIFSYLNDINKSFVLKNICEDFGYGMIEFSFNQVGNYYIDYKILADDYNKIGFLVVNKHNHDIRYASTLPVE